MSINYNREKGFSMSINYNREKGFQLPNYSTEISELYREVDSLKKIIYEKKTSLEKTIRDVYSQKNAIGLNSHIFKETCHYLVKIHEQLPILEDVYEEKNIQLNKIANIDSFVLKEESHLKDSLTGLSDTDNIVIKICKLVVKMDKISKRKCK
jgi:F420-0:gamma-glutamyl ligase-like protein